MTDEIREQLSALIDDELTELERPLLLGRVQRDAALLECLGRYQLIGEVMRGAGRTATLSVAGRVQQAVEQESTQTAAPARHPAKHWKPLAGMGVAASVALLAIVAVTSLRDSTPTDSTPVVASVAGGPQLASSAEPDERQWDRIEPRIDERLSGYLVNHSEYAASRGVQGMMPYVRIVGFDSDR
jgi:sigma-E factor negative regulatory protein RseA